LHEIGPMTRNPERDTERSRVVRARSPSLVVLQARSISRLVKFSWRRSVMRHFLSVCQRIWEWNGWLHETLLQNVI